MHIENEVMKLRRITNAKDLFDVIKALNNTLLSGTNPSIIIRELQSLEERTVSNYKKYSAREEELIMSFADELKNKSNEKKLEYAKRYLEDIKPKLIQSAEEGYKGYRFEIEKSCLNGLHVMSSKVFIEHLNESLDGVEVEYKKHFRESPFLKGYGSYEHYLIFSW